MALCGQTAPFLYHHSDTSNIRTVGPIRTSLASHTLQSQEIEECGLRDLGLLHTWPCRSKSKSAVTIEQSAFPKIHESKTFYKYRANSVSTTVGQQRSALEQLERMVKGRHTHGQTDYCNPPAHEQRVKYILP